MRRKWFFNKFKTVKLLFIFCFVSIFLYLIWLPYVPNLKYENPKTTALTERRINQAKKKRKKIIVRMNWRSLNEISPNLIHAVLLAEDDTFYRHHGFDFEQIRIAFKINWKKKKFAYGGSTITQQLARTLYLSPSKNILRKLKEAVIALWMEMTLPKKRILELYLNCAEWGEGIFGAEAAAQHYYGKSCSALSPQESVALASILPSPRKWNPHKETPFMIRRRADILSRMKASGYMLSEEEKEKEKSEIFDGTTDDDNGEDRKEEEPISKNEKSNP